MILSTYIYLSILILIYMSFWYVVSIIRKRNDVADIAWGFGFLLVAVYVFFVSFEGYFPGRSILVTTLVMFWAMRLSLHIYFRNKGKPEDYRYQKWREEWGKWFYLRTFFQVFLLQGVLLLCVVLPVVVINLFKGGPLGWLDLVGVLVWVLGFVFETVGDYQLSRFMNDPNSKGKLMTTGLWKYTRHPNYFGEVTQWWGIYIIALSVPYYGLFSILGPAVITFLILKVSGVPLLESKMQSHPDFPRYKASTSVFFPLPQRKI